MIQRIKDLFIRYKELISYLFFGFVTTVVNWIVYAIMVRAMSVDLSSVSNSDNVVYSVLHGESGRNIISLFVANLVAWFAGVIVAFVTNKLWVFKSKSFKPSILLKEIWEFIAARIVTGAMEWFGIPALVMFGMNKSLFGIEGFWAKLIVSVAVVVLNYVFSKFIIFKKKKK